MGGYGVHPDSALLICRHIHCRTRARPEIAKYSGHAGIHVFPRMADPVELDRYDRAQERMSSGVPALDALLDDGYYRGASTLLAGPSGVGKTLLALHFIFAGAGRGETGVIATFQETDPAAADPERVLLVLGRSGCRAHVPQPRRSVS
jgi:RecA/RadA recombinase